MTDDEVQAEIDDLTEALGASPAMDPARASQKQSLDFLEGVETWARAGLQAMRDEMGDGG